LVACLRTFLGDFLVHQSSIITSPQQPRGATIVQFAQAAYSPRVVAAGAHLVFRSSPLLLMAIVMRRRVA